MRFFIVLGIVFLTAKIVLAGGLQDGPESKGEGKGTIGILPENAVASTDPFMPRCGRGVPFDSFGRGIKLAVLGHGREARYSDPECYRLGAEFARKELDADDGFHCKEEFLAGHALGLSASEATGGSTCHLLGHRAGQADLGIGAREKDVSAVGADCVAAYARGVAEFAPDRVMTSPGQGPKIDACYGLGWFEAPLRY